jgi:hypothetical protein
MLLDWIPRPHNRMDPDPPRRIDSLPQLLSFVLRSQRWDARGGGGGSGSMRGISHLGRNQFVISLIFVFLFSFPFPKFQVYLDT